MVASNAGIRQQSAIGTLIYTNVLQLLILIIIGLQTLGLWRFVIIQQEAWIKEG